VARPAAAAVLPRRKFLRVVSDCMMLAPLEDEND
jgi:hypothetical protein